MENNRKSVFVYFLDFIYFVINRGPEITYTDQISAKTNKKCKSYTHKQFKQWKKRGRRKQKSNRTIE